MSASVKPQTKMSFSIEPEQAEAIDAFQAREKLSTRAEAVRLLLEIALDSINRQGRRFWDIAPAGDQPGDASRQS